MGIICIFLTTRPPRIIISSLALTNARQITTCGGTVDYMNDFSMQLFSVGILVHGTNTPLSQTPSIPQKTYYGPDMSWYKQNQGHYQPQLGAHTKALSIVLSAAMTAFSGDRHKTLLTVSRSQNSRTMGASGQRASRICTHPAPHM